MPAWAQAESTGAQTAWRLLDYVSVDYGAAVEDARVVNEFEYAEMVEFAREIRTRLAELPLTNARSALVDRAALLEDAIDRKAPALEVETLARSVGRDLLAAYPVPLAPSTVPDLMRGAELYRERCAACHGATGAADGPSAAGLDPPPIAFTDRDRASHRSLFGLYQVIGQGLGGTSMASFSDLSADDRWALAFFVGSLAYSDREAASGRRVWDDNPMLRQQVPDLETLAQLTPAALATTSGNQRAEQLTAFLRRHPEAATSLPAPPLALARTRLDASVSAYEAGDPGRAVDLALSAYLDGVEPVEAALRTRDHALVVRIETAMGEFRAALKDDEPAPSVRDRANRLQELVRAAEQELSAEPLGMAAGVLGAFTILLREGLEALLLVTAIIGFLRQAERTDVLPYVQGGWMAALAAGVLTWFAATYLISISGASRETIEGVGSIVASVVLVFVGVWLHRRASADVWQRHIRQTLSYALSKKSAWLLFALAFLVVYREVFETILFYAALFDQGSTLAILLGASAGAVTLAIVAWVLLAGSRKLPIAQFFAASSLLIAALAVVMAGKGMAALQEAGLVGIWPAASIPRVELLGLYPTWEVVFAQGIVGLALVAGFWSTGRLRIAGSDGSD